MLVPGFPLLGPCWRGVRKWQRRCQARGAQWSMALRANGFHSTVDRLAFDLVSPPTPPHHALLVLAGARILWGLVIRSSTSSRTRSSNSEENTIWRRLAGGRSVGVSPSLEITALSRPILLLWHKGWEEGEIMSLAGTGVQLHSAKGHVWLSFPFLAARHSVI